MSFVHAGMRVHVDHCGKCFHVGRTHARPHARTHARLCFRKFWNVANVETYLYFAYPNVDTQPVSVSLIRSHSGRLR